MVKKMCGLKGKEITRGWRKLHNRKPHNLHSLPGIIQFIKSKREVGEAGRTYEGEKETFAQFWCVFFFAS
jgi:hypothetical protein